MRGYFQTTIELDISESVFFVLNITVWMFFWTMEAVPWILRTLYTQWVIRKTFIKRGSLFSLLRSALMVFYFSHTVLKKVISNFHLVIIPFQKEISFNLASCFMSSVSFLIKRHCQHAIIWTERNPYQSSFFLFFSLLLRIIFFSVGCPYNNILRFFCLYLENLSLISLSKFNLNTFVQ